MSRRGDGEALPGSSQQCTAKENRAQRLEVGQVLWELSTQHAEGKQQANHEDHGKRADHSGASIVDPEPLGEAKMPIK